MNGEKNPINITLLLLNVSNLAGSEESGGGGRLQGLWELGK